jgi:hypothetical protein
VASSIEKLDILREEIMNVSGVTTTDDELGASLSSRLEEQNALIEKEKAEKERLDAKARGVEDLFSASDETADVGPKNLQKNVEDLSSASDKTEGNGDDWVDPIGPKNRRKKQQMDWRLPPPLPTPAKKPDANFIEQDEDNDDDDEDFLEPAAASESDIERLRRMLE